MPQSLVKDFNDMVFRKATLLKSLTQEDEVR
jgi:hypothetical protein